MPTCAPAALLAASTALACLLAAAPGAAQSPAPGPAQTNSDRQGDRITQGGGVTQDTRQTPGQTPNLQPGHEPSSLNVPQSNQAPTGTRQTTGMGMFSDAPIADFQWRASELVGQTIYNKANEPIGEVQELLVERDGRVSVAIVGVGGVLGMGQRNVAINYGSFQTVTDNNTKSQRLVLDADSRTLRDAPEFRRPDTWRQR